MLTEKECNNAFDRVARFCSFYDPYKDAEHLKLHGELDVLFNLIEEHFSNPPLKFEELKPKMWVWDNKKEKYNKIVEAYEGYNGKAVSFYYTTGEERKFAASYEPYRYYRKEVKDGN